MKEYHPLISSNLQILTLPLTTLLAFTLLFTCTNCNKDDDTSPADQLPPITMEGKGTFACLINGEVWKWKGRNPWNGFPNLDTYYHEPTNGLFIQAKKDDDETNTKLQTINIGSFVDSIGSYTISFDNRTYVDYTQNNSDCITFQLDTLQKRQLNIIKLDKEAKIISGTFEFTVINDCDTLRITEGRFDDFYRE